MAQNESYRIAYFTFDLMAAICYSSQANSVILCHPQQIQATTTTTAVNRECPCT